LRPDLIRGHGHMTRNRSLLVWLIGYPGLAPFTLLHRCDQRAMLAVRGKTFRLVGGTMALPPATSNSLT
jgi:hypothetical protein